MPTKYQTRFLSALFCAVGVSALSLTATPVAAQSNAAQEVSIKAQPLDAALLEVGRRYGVTITAPNALVGGKRASRLNGLLTAEQSIERLLRGTGLTYQRTRRGFMVVRATAKLSPASATSSAPAQPEAVEQVESAPIIVTGTKANFSVQNTIESVAVVTAEQIEQRAVNNVNDVLLRTANVTTSGVDPNALSIRGISLAGVGNTGEGSTSQVYVDGAPTTLDSNQGAFNLWDIEQIEVLRGPQSTTQGRNALSGALIIRSADPEYDWGAAARVLYGNENQLQASAMITGPIIPDQLAFRIAADYREVDFGVVNQDTGINTRFNEALTLRGKLLFEPEFADGLRLELIANYISTDFGEFGVVNAPPVGDPRAATFDPFGDETFGGRIRLEDNEVQRYIADVSYELSDSWELIALGTYERTERRASFGADGSSSPDTDTYSAELRANFDYSRVSGWFGGYYFDSRRVSPAVFAFSPGLLGLPTIPDGAIVSLINASDERIENFAFFGDLTFEVNDNLRLNIGARYDNERLDLQNNGTSVSEPASCIIAPFIPGLGGLPCNLLFPVTDEPRQISEFDAFLPRASVFYNLDDDRSIGLLVARGYRAGGSFVFSTPANPGVVEVRQFDPEFLTNYEIAFRSYWPELNLTLNANLFYSDWTDQQITVPGPSNAPLDIDIVNAGSSEIYGLEIEAVAEVTPEFSVFTSFGLLETEFNDFPFAQTGEFANLAGNEFNAAPNVTLSAGIVYDQPEGLFFSGDLALASSQFSDVENLRLDRTDSYALVNGRIGYRFGFAEISLFVNNLFDERFFLRRDTRNVDAETSAITVNQVANFTVNDPRLWGVEARIRF
ncbi:MAG: TonB-dependent receptor [Pseudomonadota bacterium]